MTRRPFGGTTSDYVELVDNSGGLSADRSVVCTLWTAQSGGTHITDLEDSGSNPITSVSTDAYGAIPVFYGPNDGTSSMWIDPGSGARALIFATDIPARLAALEAGTAFSTVFAPLGDYTAQQSTAENSKEDLSPVLVYFTSATPGATYSHTGDTNFVDVDAANLIASIVVPQSGKVFVALTGEPTVTGGTAHSWGLADAGGDLAETQGEVTSNAGRQRTVHNCLITKDSSGVALVPGNVLTLRWRYRVNNSTQTVTITYGTQGGSGGSGPLIMELTPMSNRVTGKKVTAAVNSAPTYQPWDVAPDGKHMLGVASSGSHLGRVAWSTDSGATWTDSANLWTPAGTSAGWYAGDGEIILRAGIVTGGSPLPGALYKSSGWAVNPATATLTRVLTANNLGGGNDVYFGSYANRRAYGKIIVASEYGPKVSATDMARYAYLSSDYGATWRTIFDLYTYGVSAWPGWDGSSAHIHTVTFDPYWDCVWVATGDANGTVKATTLVSFDWRAPSPTWQKVYDQHQFTVIVPMPGCVLFVTDQGTAALDGIGNGVMRLRRTGRDSAAVNGLEVAKQYDAAVNQSIIGATWTRHPWIPDAPTLIALGETATSGPTGRILATYDGFIFKELWTAVDTGTLGGLSDLVGPVGGKIIASYRASGDSSNTEQVTLTLT